MEMMKGIDNTRGVHMQQTSVNSIYASGVTASLKKENIINLFPPFPDSVLVLSYNHLSRAISCMKHLNTMPTFNQCYVILYCPSKIYQQILTQHASEKYW